MAASQAGAKVRSDKSLPMAKPREQVPKTLLATLVAGFATWLKSLGKACINLYNRFSGSNSEWVSGAAHVSRGQTTL